MPWRLLHPLKTNIHVGPVATDVCAMKSTALCRQVLKAFVVGFALLMPVTFVAGVPTIQPRGTRGTRGSPSVLHALDALDALDGIDGTDGTVVSLVSQLGIALGAAAFIATAVLSQRREALKKDLLQIIRTTKRGADESKNAEVKRLFMELETLNPTSEPLSSDQLRGDWELLWTTSPAILGLGRPGFFQPLQDQPILQFLDPQEGVARNLEFTALGRNTVDASIAPLGPDQREAFVSRLDDFLLFKQGAEENPGGSYLPQVDGLEKTTVGVRFKVFTLFGLLPIPAPASATGILQVTYLDNDLRLSRGDRGNLFVLKKVSSEMSA